MTARTPLGLFLKAFNEYEENKKENLPPGNDHPQRASLEFLCFAGTNWTSGVPIPQVSEAIGQQAFLDLDILVSMLKSLEKQHNGIFSGSPIPPSFRNRHGYQRGSGKLVLRSVR